MCTVREFMNGQLIAAGEKSQLDAMTLTGLDKRLQAGRESGPQGQDRQCFSLCPLFT